MSTGRWTHDELRALVRGRLVFLRDGNAMPLAVPSWLARDASGTDERSSDEMLAHVHPDDRLKTIETFLTSLDSPGEVVEERVRFERDGVWGHRHLCWLNLLADPEVAAMVVSSEFFEGEPVVVDAMGDLPAHYEEGTRWMAFYCNRSDASILRAEGRVHELVGYAPDELIGRRVIEFVHPEGAAIAVDAWVRMWTSGNDTAVTARRWMRKDGSEVWLESWYLNRAGTEGEVTILILDITERRNREVELQTSHQEFQLLADEAPAAVFRCDVDGTVLFRNARWAEIAGSDEAAGVGDVVHPDDRAAVGDAIRGLIAEPGTDRVEIEARGVDGRVLAIALRAVSARVGERQTVMGSIEDVTGTVELRRQAEADSLTGLLNRSSIESRVSCALATDPAGILVVFVDLDGFKAVNDRHGHEAGDVVLCEIGTRLRAAVRPTDVVGRFGGDEFVIVCRDIGVEDESSVIEAVRSVFIEPVVWPGGRWDADGSMGAARGRDDDDVSSFIRRADLAMFAVKHERHLSRARPVSVVDERAAGSERLDIETRSARLTTLLAEHPSAEVCAVDSFGVLIPWPSSVPLQPSHVLDDRSSLDAVAEQDHPAAIRAFQSASRTGVGEAQVRLTRDPGRWVVVQVIDVRERHGIVARVIVTAEGVDAGAPELVDEAGGTEAARIGHIREDVTGFILDYDEDYASMMGESCQALIGRQALDLVHPDDQEVAITVFLEVLQDAQTRRGRWRTVTTAGRIFWTEVNLCMVDGEVLLDVYDVSDEVHSRHTARAQELRLERIADAVPVGLFETDLTGGVLYANQRAHSLLGVATSRRVDALLANVVAEHRCHLDEALETTLSSVGAANVDVEVELRMPTGDLRQCEMSFRPMKDAVEQVTGAIVCVTDVTERARARLELERELVEHAFHDSLTGLPNRTLLLNRMEEAVARSRTSGDLVAVVSIDVDGFAAVNRRFGHAVGDEVLRRVSDRLRRVARAGDTVARVGGDEFIVLMDGFFDPDLPRYIAEHIAGVLSQPFDIDGQAVGVSAGIGIATSVTSKEAGDLLHHADVAMRRAKSSGTSHEVFDPERHDAAPARNELVASLREAVAAGDFLVLYQPIQELASGLVTNVEALVRWRHPERGMIVPADFIPLAEDSGLIVPIGRFVLEQACREASRWAERYGSAAPGISVNLSACQLREPAFVDHVDEILRTTGLAPGALTLEITETVLVEDLDRAVAVLEQLHELGVELAIDDFGTGYNSIAYLQEFPVDVLKIDKVFVDRLGDGDGDEGLIAGILGLARNLGMRTVAEGIETESQLHVLRRLGCADGQGFLFSRPIDAAAIAEYLVRRNPVLWASSEDAVVVQAGIATPSEASTR